MAFDYSKLRGKIREIFKTQKNFAKSIGISSASLSAKLNNSTDFTQDEISKAIKALKLSTDDVSSYFFAPKVQ